MLSTAAVSATAVLSTTAVSAAVAKAAATAGSWPRHLSCCVILRSPMTLWLALERCPGLP